MESIKSFKRYRITTGKIWQRYLLLECLKVFLLFLFCFYFLYVLIDYSIHAKTLNKAPYAIIAIHYLCHFAKRADIIIPFALMLGSVKVLSSMNLNNELSTMLASGISLKKLVRPLILLGVFFTLLLFLNFETLEPIALKKLDDIEDVYFHNRSKQIAKRPVNVLPLDDQTKLIFQSYDPDKKALLDVFWIRDNDHIYHIKHLYPYEVPPIGRYIHQLQRNSMGQFELKQTYVKKSLLEMKIDFKSLFQNIVPVRNESISRLWKHMRMGTKGLNNYRAELQTAFHYKLAMPLLAILVIIASAPYCTRFSRHIPIFIIFTLSIVGLLSFFTIMNAAYILGENQVLTPALIIWMPFVLFFSFFYYQFLKMDN